jgi:hypothetical protein
MSVKLGPSHYGKSVTEHMVVIGIIFGPKKALTGGYIKLHKEMF